MRSSASFLLSASVEDLVYTGSGNFTGTGNSGVSSDGGGNDLPSAKEVLVGGAGDDLLNGGTGRDIFVFGAGFGHDAVQDFAVSGCAHDIVEIDSDLFDDFDSLLAASSQNLGDVFIAHDEATSLTLEGR